MRNAHIKTIIFSIAALLGMLLPAQAAKAETLEEQLNNRIGPEKQYNTALSPVYLRNNASEEAISTQSGDLTLDQTDYVLPGKNGLDLEIKRLYKSGTSNVQEMKAKYVDGAWVDYVYSDAGTSSFYEDRYDLGIGMRFSFPAMEIKQNDDGSSHKFLHTEAGDVYRLIDPSPEDGAETYVPENQTIKDVTVNVSADFSNGQADGTSRYIMVGKDGKRTYFSDDGRVLGIVDRYGNTIKFEYAASAYTVDSVTKTKKRISRITDTVGRVTTIEYKEDQNFTVGPVNNTAYSAEESYKTSQNPNTMYSGDLAGKFQVVVHLPGGKDIVYDKTAVSVSASRHVLRTRLQRVFDVDGKPKYHFWYEQPSLGFSFTSKSSYGAYNRYENLVQVDDCRNNRLTRYTYETFTKGLNDGGMQYRKIFEKKELIKTGYDPSKTDFPDRFACDVADQMNYAYVNEPDGFQFNGYQEHNDSYLKNTYRYYGTKTDLNGTATKYTYDGLHELLETEETGSGHKKIIVTENDEMKFPKKIETTLYNMANGQTAGQPSVKIENFQYDQYGNLTNYTGPLAERDANGYPVDTEHTVVYSYAYDKFHTLSQKSWKQDGNTACQIINTIDEVGNITREQKVNTDDPLQWVSTDYQYDGSGNLTKKTVHSSDNTYETRYAYGVDADGNDHRGAYLTKEYSVVNGAELAKQYTYAPDTGNRTAEIDENGNRTGYEYDALGRITKILYADGSSRQYRYRDHTAANREVEYLDPIGTRYLYEYDIFDHIVRYGLSDGGQWKTLARVEFDFRGNKVKDTDSNGNVTAYSYDSDNRLTKKTFYEKDAAKKESVALSYTLGISAAAPLLLTVTDEDGYAKKYYYDAADQLVKLEETPDKMNYFTKTYEYNYTGSVVSETDALGAKTEYIYDNLGRLAEKVDALNNATVYRYNSLGQVLSEEAPGGKITQTIYDAAGRKTEERTYTKGSADYYYKKTAYDKAGNVTASSEGKAEGGKDSPSSGTEFTFDSRNRVADEYGYIEAGRKSHTHYTYDANGNKLETVEYSGQSGGQYLKYTYAYDFAGRLIREEGTSTGTGMPAGEGASAGGGRQSDPAVTGHYLKKYTPDYEGNVLKEEQYDGSRFWTTEYTYDYRNRLLSKTEPYTSDGKTKRTAYAYDKRGNLASETVTVQGAPCVTSYRYDGMGRLAEKTDAMRHTTRYVYDGNGNLTKEIDPRYYGLDEESAPGTEYEYDSLGRQVKAVAFDGTDRTVVSYREYDGRGNVTKDADSAGYDASRPGLSFGKQYEYDAADNVVRYKSAQAAKDSGSGEGYTRTYAYDGSGRVTAEKDSNGGITRTVWYLNGLLQETTYPDGSKESYTYDDTGKLRSVKTDRNGNTTATYINVFGKPYRIEYPDQTFETFAYTAEGYMKESRDRNGNASLFEYDPAGNVASQKEYVSSDAAADCCRLTEYTRDEAGRALTSETFSLKTSKGTGRELSRESAGDRVSNSYDKAGGLVAVHGPSGRETVNTYDAAGNVVTIRQKIDDGAYKVRRFEYDTRSRKVKESLLLDVSDLEGTRLERAEFDDEHPAMVKSNTVYAYYAGDRVKSVTDANGNMTSFEYDLDGRLVKKLQPMNVTTLYRYDGEGNLTCETNGRGVSTYYDYDAMNRVVREKAPSAGGEQAVTRYIYDAMGNLLKTILPNAYDALKDTPEQADEMPGEGYTYDSMNRPVATTAPTGETVQYIAYDANGNVKKKVDGLRYTGSISASPGTVYEYDGLGRAVRATDALGSVSSTGYDILGNVAGRTDALGHTTGYEYNPDGTLAKVIYPDGGTVVFSYDLLGRMSSRTDQRGNTSDFEYNAFDKLKKEKDPYGNSITRKYDLKGNECAVTDKRGSATAVKYDALDRPAKKRIPLELDETGNISYAVENYVYDEAGNLIATVKTGTKDPGSGRETAYSYYDNDLVRAESNNNGSSIAYAYDLNGNLTKKETLREVVDGVSRYDIEKHTYDSMDRLLQSIRLIDADDLYNTSGRTNLENLMDSEYPGMVKLITGYSYDILGNKTGEIPPAGYGFAESDTAGRDRYATRYAYDELNRLVKVTKKYIGDGSETARDIYASYTYDAVGNRISEKDEKGHITTWTYDSLNRQKSVTDAAGYTLTYGYDPAGNRTSAANAKGHTMTWSYDRLNREENITDAYGAVISRKLYDENGNLVKEIDAKGYLSASDDSARYGTLYSYDLANRLTGVAKPEAAAKGKVTETYEYNPYGDRTSVADTLGNTAAYEYDNGGNLIKVVDALGVATFYGYDRAGNKTYMTDGRGKTTSYSYGAFGKLSRMVDAENKEITYQYDLAGNLAAAVDRNGRTTLYAYDNRNLLLEKKADTGEQINYAYDEAGNRTGMADESGSYTYSFDVNDRLMEIRKDGSLQTGYTYDELGNIASVTDSLGFATSYTYDKSSRMETVACTGLTVAYAYDENGNRESVAYSSGIRETFRYDRDNHLLALTNRGTDGAVLSSYEYAYDLAGRQISKTDSYGATRYTYDADGRILREATPGRTAVYTYDKAGNRASLNETYVSEQPAGFIDSATGKEIKYILKKADYAYSSADRLTKLIEKMCDLKGRVLLTKTTVYLYDANGNQVSQTTSYTAPGSIRARQTVKGSSYGDGLAGEIDPLITRTGNTFDSFNRLAKTEQIQGGVRTLAEYTYNGDGLRTQRTVKKSDSGYTPEETIFLYDRQHVILETGTDGSLKTRYIRGINYLASIGSTEADDNTEGTEGGGASGTEGEGASGNSAGGYSVLLYNGHGDVVQTADNAGNIRNSYDYDIWGNVTFTLEQYSFSIRYAGEFFDKETGLYYLRARYYNPYIGRFISEDSYRGEDNNPLSLNLYTYCHNDPVNFIDPTGHWEQGDEKMSKADQNRLKKLTADYNAAKKKGDLQAAEDAHRAAVALRESSGKRNDYEDEYNYHTKEKKGSGSTYSKGSAGTAVKEIQTVLTKKKYSVGKSGTDGLFGKATEGAVVRFQIDQGIEYDGIVGKETARRLGVSLAEYTNSGTGKTAKSSADGTSPGVKSVTPAAGNSGKTLQYGVDIRGANNNVSQGTKSNATVKTPENPNLKPNGQNKKFSGYGGIEDINKYVSSEYGTGWTRSSSATISGVDNFVQKELEEDANNCTLASITRIMKYYSDTGYTNIPSDIKKIYKKVREIGVKHDYDPKKTGLLRDMFVYTPWEIDNMVEDTWDAFDYSKGSADNSYINKLSTIKTNIDNSNPMLLNISSGDYGGHTVTVVGYTVFSQKDKDDKSFIQVFDGWSETVRYIDWAKFNDTFFKANLTTFSPPEKK